MRKFAVIYVPCADGVEIETLMVEAPDQREAASVLAEEVGPDVDLRGRVIWNATTDLRWRSAWRHGRVRVLRVTKLPTGIE